MPQHCYWIQTLKFIFTLLKSFTFQTRLGAHKLPLRSGHGLILTPLKPWPKTVLESDICLSLKWGHVYSGNTEVWVSLSRDNPAPSPVEIQPIIDSFHSFSFPQYLNLSFSWAILASPYSEWTSGIKLPSLEIILSCQMCLRSLRSIHHAVHKRLVVLLGETDSSYSSRTKSLPVLVTSLPNSSTVIYPLLPPYTLSSNTSLSLLLHSAPAMTLNSWGGTGLCRHW